MLVVIDFNNGPWTAPEPFHSHIHEQASYVAEGELIFSCEGEPDKRLSSGDMFWVPSNKNHTIQLLSATARLIDSFNPLREDFLA
jgi:quercetin dioxygenase-like cupin family protein